MHDGVGCRLLALCFRANDPLGLARFWAAALRWDLGDEGDGRVALVPSDGTRFTVIFVRSSDAKAGPNRMHVDLTTTSLDDQQASVDALVERGARPIDIGQRPNEPHVVLADPEGNEL